MAMPLKKRRTSPCNGFLPHCLALVLVAILSMFSLSSQQVLHLPDNLAASPTQDSPVQQSDSQLLQIFKRTGTVAALDRSIAKLKKAMQDSQPEYKKRESAERLAVAFCRRALMYEKAGNFGRSNSDFQEAVSLSFRILPIHAAYMERGGKMEAALEDWKCSLKENHHETEDEQRLAELLEKLERLPEAEKRWDGIANNAYHPESYLRGQFFERRKNQKDAVKDFKGHRLALYYERQNQPDLAEKVFLDCQPFDHEEFACFYERQSKLDKAEAVLNIIDYPSDDICRARAKLFERHNRLAAALNDFDRVIQEFGKDTGEDHLAIMRLLARSGRIEEAQKAAIDLLSAGRMEKESQQEAGNQRRAQIYLAFGKPEEALALLAPTEVDRNEWALFTWAVALEKIGLKSEAQRCYRQYLSDYQFDETKRTSIESSLCANYMRQRLLALGGQTKVRIPAFVDHMSFIPLPLLDLQQQAKKCKSTFPLLWTEPGLDEAKPVEGSWEKYMQTLVAKIASNWTGPHEQPSIMTIKLNRHGYLQGWSFYQGHSLSYLDVKNKLTRADEKALSAVLASIPFAPLPEWYDAHTTAVFRIDMANKQAESVNPEQIGCWGFAPYEKELLSAIAANWHPDQSKIDWSCNDSRFEVSISKNGKIQKEWLMPIAIRPEKKEDQKSLDQAAWKAIESTCLPLPQWYSKKYIGYEPDVAHFSIDFSNSNQTINRIPVKDLKEQN